MTNTRTGIEWTDVTWSPVVGCSHVSAGCAHCYAETMDRRIRGIAGQEWKPWTAPNASYNVRLHPERLTAPLHWKRPRRVFVNSMSDLFHERVPDEYIDRVFAVMALTPQHQYQVLTKRPERMREYLCDMGAHYMAEVDGEYMERWGDAAVELTGDPCSAGGPIEDCGWPLPNVWLGVSVEDQAAADERIPLLLETPAAVRFLSCEPLLGPVDLTDSLRSGTFFDLGSPDISWVIVGGESGPGARPCDLAWIRSIVAQCGAAGVACFVKQLGARPYSTGEATVGHFPGMNAVAPGHPHRFNYRPRDRKGGEPSEWPEELRVREMPR